jgi:hypothetical protein
MKSSYKAGKKKRRAITKQEGTNSCYQPFITSIEVINYIIHLFYKGYDICHIFNNKTYTNMNYTPHKTIHRRKKLDTKRSQMKRLANTQIS